MFEANRLCKHRRRGPNLALSHVSYLTEDKSTVPQYQNSILQDPQDFRVFFSPPVSNPDPSNVVTIVDSSMSERHGRMEAWANSCRKDHWGKALQLSNTWDSDFMESWVVIHLEFRRRWLSSLSCANGQRRPDALPLLYDAGNHDEQFLRTR